MWSLFDGQDVLNEIDPAFSANIARHVRRAQLLDPFHVPANTDPKGNRSTGLSPPFKPAWPQAARSPRCGRPG